MTTKSNKTADYTLDESNPLKRSEGYEKELFAPDTMQHNGRHEKSVRLDFELYVKLDRWKSKLRLVFPGKKITLHAILNRGIYLVCEELKDRYGPLD